MRGDRRDLLLVVLLTLGIGAGWAGLAPLFHETDEPQHVAYVQAVAELGHPPRQLNDTGLFSDELSCWYDSLAVPQIRWIASVRPPWSAQARDATATRCDAVSRAYDGAQYHALQPPAYYLLASVPYRAGDTLSLPTRVLLMRLLSAVFAAIAVAATYLLVRELVPGSRWPARAGALALALQPIFMFNDVAVNPDTMVVALSALIALVGARSWRRGVTWRRALAFGALTGVGVVTKVNFLALLPSIALLGIALWWAAGHSARELGARAARLGAGALLAFACLGVYALLDDRVWHRATTYQQTVLQAPGANLGGFLSHAWQFFLPPLPFMHDLFAKIPAFELLAKGVSSRLGWWNDYGIAQGWMRLVLLATVPIVAGAIAYVAPRARRRPWPLLVIAACAGLFIGALLYADYRFSLTTHTSTFEGRYAFPAMPLWGVVVGCCVAGVRPRWRGPLTGLLATLFLAHTLLAVGATLQRYYL